MQKILRCSRCHETVSQSGAYPSIDLGDLVSNTCTSINYSREVYIVRYDVANYICRFIAHPSSSPLAFAMNRMKRRCHCLGLTTLSIIQLLFYRFILRSSNTKVNTTFDYFLTNARLFHVYLTLVSVR